MELIMSKKITFSVVVFILGLLLAACGSGNDQAAGESPQNQPEAPSNEPYPAPEQEHLDLEETSPGDPNTPVSIENPYPEPIEPGLVVVPSDHEYAPVSGDDALLRGNVFIDAGEVLLLESYPVQVRLKMIGNLPTPCHQMRAIISPPNDQNQIHIEAYSLSNPDTICTQVLEPIDAEIPLGAYTEGAFTIFVNEFQIGDFNLP
jgi:hypothetical protein